MADSPTSALQQILPVLNRSSVPYVIIGAVASGILGRPRATLDVDILVGGGSQGLTKISSLIEKSGGEKFWAGPIYPATGRPDSSEDEGRTRA